MNQASAVRTGRLSAALRLTAVLAVLAAPAAQAATPGNTSLNGIDFPAVVPSTSIVGEGDVQLETNVARTKDGTDPAVTSVWSTPTLLRLGMPNYEIRIESPVYTHARTPVALSTGMSDITLGLKGVIPQTIDKDISVALMLQAAFPSGSTDIKNKGVRPELQAVAAWDLPHNNRVSGVMGIRSDVDNTTDERYSTGILGLNYSYTWTRQVRTYAELAGREIRTASRGGKNMMYNFGGSYAFLPGTQLNAQAGWGPKDNDTDMAWSVGVSTRFHPAMPGAMSHNQKKAKADETPRASSEDGK